MQKLHSRKLPQTRKDIAPHTEVERSSPSYLLFPSFLLSSFLLSSFLPSAVASPAMASPAVPYTVKFDKAEVADLRARPKATRWPTDVEGVSWQHGAPLKWIQSLAKDFSDFDFSAAEARLNQVRLSLEKGKIWKEKREKREKRQLKNKLSRCHRKKKKINLNINLSPHPTPQFPNFTAKIGATLPAAAKKKEKSKKSSKGKEGD